MSEAFWPPGIRAAAAVTFDVDAESAILAGDPAAACRLGVMTHQAYGPRTGVPRLLGLLADRDIRATFFVPGYTAERWPDTVRAIRDAGHEIGHHGYLHEPLGADEAAEERYLLRGLAALDAVAGVRPVGYRAPMWETSHHTPGLLARHGFRYDSSLMDADRPYPLATGAADAGGAAPTLVEIPIQWGLDDWEQYAYLPDLTGSGLIESPVKVMEMWRLERDATFAAGGCLVLTMHPFLSGRPSRAAALAGFLDELVAMREAGIWVAALDEIAAHVATLQLPAVHHDRPAIPEGRLPR
ncbi:MAG TPA: polysaccharide deacetylase [Candidatus Sulfotelmatobacter sp.]|nr:polysaccharide deacetylase [Candidatus Sulfotelmatobacter sp.]